MNATAVKFGAPDTVLADYTYWTLLLRPVQVTLGSLVLICREPAQQFGEISQSASAELQVATAAIESVLQERFQFDRINYLMLMMVDPDVHFHVLPRYESAREFDGHTFIDAAWPGPPDITSSSGCAESTMTELRDTLRSEFA